MAAPRKDNVKELIIISTEKLMKKQKLADISFASIAKEAGISKGTLYYHYKSKNDILFDIMDKYLSAQWDDLIKWTEDPKKDTSINRLVQYVMERDIANANMRLNFFYDAMMGNEEVREKLLKRYEDFEHIIAEKIGERTEAMSADYLAWVILLLSDGLFIHQTIHNDRVDSEAFIKQTGIFVKMLADTKKAAD